MYQQGTDYSERHKMDDMIRKKDLQLRVILSNIQDEENKPFRRAYEKYLYPNAYCLTNLPTIQQQLISNQNVSDKIEAEYEIEATRDEARKHILYLTVDDITATQYILDNLSNEYLASLNQNYSTTYKDIKKLFPKGISKEAFVSYIKDRVKFLNTKQNQERRNLEQEQEQERKFLTPQKENQLNMVIFIQTQKLFK